MGVPLYGHTCVGIYVVPIYMHGLVWSLAFIAGSKGRPQALSVVDKDVVVSPPRLSEVRPGIEDEGTRQTMTVLFTWP